MIAPMKLREDYWTSFSVDPVDIDFIYNRLLEKEIPQTPDELLRALVNQRIANQVEELQNQISGNGETYLPKDNYAKGDKLVFPAMDMQTGKVSAVREGFNPEFENLKVIEVKMDSGEVKSFASNVAEHPLNQAMEAAEDDPNLNPDIVLEEHFDFLKERLEEALRANDDLVKITGSWFPRSLLVDIGVGYLNLAEAVLEETNGGPMAITDLIKQVELDGDDDPKLLEFSFDIALQEDKRFDEVGPAGETLWFLHDMEPDDVKQIPEFLTHKSTEYSKEGLQEYLDLFEGNLYDELESWDSAHEEEKIISISLTYPHWRSGTLPLSNTLKRLFPTAHEAPRVKFTFIDAKNKDEFSGWVVRPHRYVYGLGEWYRSNELMPGSIIKVKRGKKQGEILVEFDKSRQNKEWLKTVLIGTDQGIVFAMLKHNISADFNERMAVAIPDINAVDEIWKNRIYEKEPMEKTILRITRELAKLNPQGQVHAQELYAAVNVVRRCPPSLILYNLINHEKISHLGDLYFRLAEKED